MNKKPVLVNIQYPDLTTVVVEVDPLYGDAGGVARRLRASGLAARRQGDIVIVNGAHVPDEIAARYT
jgi:hypothetical protein